MAEFRTIKMSFWSDPYVEKLPAEGKLLYLYIISCQNMNNLGVLETSAGRISFETGIARETVEHVLRILERDGKIVREGDWLWLASFIANQCSTSPRLVQSLRSLWERIPSEKIRRAAAERYPHILAGEAQEEDGEAPCDGEDGEAEDTDVEATLGRRGARLRCGSGNSRTPRGTGEVGWWLGWHAWSFVFALPSL